MRVLLALTLSVAAGNAQRALHRVLEARLSRMQPGAKTTAFVHLTRQVDIRALVARLDRMNATRPFRHSLVVQSLRQVARQSQPKLDSFLESRTKNGEVESWTSFWIFNGYAVRATKRALLELAARSDVAMLYWAGSDAPGEQDLIEPVRVRDTSPLSSGPESGLLECRADYVWGKGFRGKGVVVANLDTGVDGNHAALKSRWRGLVPGVRPNAAWFDPIGGTTTPNDLRGHGTHTMGTICGNDGGTNQIGMAPDAQWIAANPIDGGGTRAQRNVWYNAAIQWFADPDGNPLTATDVPVVVGNSWGVRDPNNGVGPCSPIFNRAIDAAEASTAAFVWAAGNESTRGPRVPADRIASDVNTFSVGALNAGSQTLASFSSRGPSPCDNKTIKPEISARGVSVRSSWRGGTYRIASGTSMACPHVAGGIALLCDVWPEVTVTRVKRLLMETADDLGAKGEDNLYGHGRINLQRAYDKLVAERPVVAISVMGTRAEVKEGTLAVAHVVISSYSGQDENVIASLELDIQGQATGYFFIPPIPITFPAGFTNRLAPIAIGLGIPTGLPTSLIGVPISIRGTLRRGTTVISQAEYEFKIKR